MLTLVAPGKEGLKGDGMTRFVFQRSPCWCKVGGSVSQQWEEDVVSLGES